MMSSALLLGLAPLGHAATARDYGHYAQQAFDQLQTVYWQPKEGFWTASMWWQTANTVEALGNLGIQQPSLRPAIAQAMAVVFAATANSTKGRCNKGVNLTVRRAKNHPETLLRLRVPVCLVSQFSGYFDDE